MNRRPPRFAPLACLASLLVAPAGRAGAGDSPLPIFPLAMARGAETGDRGWWLGADTMQYAMLGPETMFCAFADTILAPPGPSPSSRPLDRVVSNSIALATRGPDGRFRPSYWFRGPIARPLPFFDDPVTRSHPDLNTYYWPNRPFVHGGKLFVFLQQRTRGKTGHLDDDRIVGSDLARVDNPGDPPDAWRIDYLKVVEHGGVPWLGTECLIRGDHVVVFGYADLGSHPNPTVAVRLPLAALLDAPAGADLGRLAEYLADSGGSPAWKPGLIGGDPWDVQIRSFTGFTVRYNRGLRKWQAVYLEEAQLTARSPSRHARVKLSAAGPFGPWEEPRDVPLTFPEFNRETTLYHPDAWIYGVREVWELCSDPDRRINVAYTNNLVVPPNQIVHEDMITNLEFYRVKLYEAANPHR